MEKIITWYRLMRDSLRITRNTLKSHPSPDRIYDKTQFSQEELPSFPPIEESYDLLNEATILLLYANFERCLLLFIQEQMLEVFAEKTRDIWLEEIALLLPEKAERWAIREILEVFRKKIEPERESLLGDIKSLYEYRNWIAHGKKGDSPAGILPERAYVLMRDFLHLAEIPNKE